MATADLLVELMFSWIEQRELCADKLKKLAQELESIREKCNISECVGSSVAVAGAASLIGAGVATLTGGLAAPVLGVVGAACSGAGVTVSVGTKITEHFISSDTMKEAQKEEEKSNKIEEKIQQLFQQLRKEVKEASSFADLDEVDQHIMTEFLRAFGRRQSHDLQIDFSNHDNELRIFFNAGQENMRLNPNFMAAPIVGLAGVFTFFTLQLSGKQSKVVFAKGAEELVKQMTKIGLKAALKGGAMVVGGAVGLVFALPEMIDNWKEMIKKNHVTEASQSLRDTADDILKMTGTLRQLLDNITRMFDKNASTQKEQEEKLSTK